jgi:hypothetical protein
MKVKVEIEIEKKESGEYTAKLLNLDLGQINNINPRDEIDRLYHFVLAKELLGNIDFIQDEKPKMDKEFNAKIRQILAKLLAYYYTIDWSGIDGEYNC